MQQTGSMYGILATYVGATASHVTSEAVVNYITITVGVLTTIKLLLEIKQKAKPPKEPSK